MGLASSLFGPRGCLGIVFSIFGLLFLFTSLLVPWYAEHTIVRRFSPNFEISNANNLSVALKAIFPLIWPLSLLLSSPNSSFKSSQSYESSNIITLENSDDYDYSFASLDDDKVPFQTGVTIISRTLSRGWFSGACEMSSTYQGDISDFLHVHPCPPGSEDTSYSWRSLECPFYDLNCTRLSRLNYISFLGILIATVGAVFSAIFVVSRTCRRFASSRTSSIHKTVGTLTFSASLGSVLYFFFAASSAVRHAMHHSTIVSCAIDGPCDHFFVDKVVAVSVISGEVYNVTLVMVPVGWLLAAVGACFFGLGFIVSASSSAQTVDDEFDSNNPLLSASISKSTRDTSSYTHGGMNLQPYSRSHNPGYSLRNHTEQRGINFLG